MKNISFISVISFVALVVISCRDAREPYEGKMVFRYNESAGITSLDPAFARDQANIWADNQIFNGLVQLDDSLRILPCIARRWEISGDGLEYTFHLRQDIYFHDSPAFPGGRGRRVTAGDFVYSLNRIADPSMASPGAWIFSLVRVSEDVYSFEAVDDSTLIIRLKSPFPPFLGLLSMKYCSVVPFEAVKFSGPDFRNHPVGTGPFRFGMWKEGVKLVLLKNPKYFESEEGARLPYLDAVSISFIPDKQSAFLEFVKGNLDFLSGIDGSYKDELLTRTGELKPKYQSSVNLLKSPYLNTEYLGILMDSTRPVMQLSPLKSRLIRKALNYSFDRTKMMRYLRNNIGTPGTHGMVPTGLPWFRQEEVEGYSYHPEKARRLLAQAGFPNGRNLPTVTLTTNASYLDLCKFIQSQSAELGIQIKIDVTPPASLREMIADAKVAFFRASWIADYPDAENYLSLFYSPNFSPAGPNFTQFCNPEFDRLYRLSNNEMNDSLRGKLYIAMDRLVMEESPVLVLYYDQVLRFSRENITGLGCNPLNLLNLKQVRKDQ